MFAVFMNGSTRTHKPPGTKTVTISRQQRPQSLSIHAANRQLCVSERLKRQNSHKTHGCKTNRVCQQDTNVRQLVLLLWRGTADALVFLSRDYEDIHSANFICTHIHIGQRSMLGIFLNSSPANFLRQVISLNLEVINLARPSSHQGPTRTLPGLYMDAEHLNSGALGHVASTLLIEHCS